MATEKPDYLNTNVNPELDVQAFFKQISTEHQEISAPVAAIKTLLEVIRYSKATTMSEFMETIKLASQILKNSSEHPISVSAGCDLLTRFVTLTSHDLTEFQTCKEYLLKSGNFVLEKAMTQKRKIVNHSHEFIRDGGTILLHSYSRVVMLLMETAAKQKKRFKVYVTESLPSKSGHRAAEHLKSLGIPSSVILDSAVGWVIEKVDMVIVGAEGVVENGGLINSIGTYQIAIIAKAARKPFYAAAESFKFVRLFPLNQYDLPIHKPFNNVFDATNTYFGESYPHPSIDYTPPQFITLLFTDLGVLTPSGVSDELIKL